MVRRALLLALVAVALAWVMPASADTADADAVTLRIEAVEADEDGTTRMTVAVSGLPAGAEVSFEDLDVVENGEPVEDLRLLDQDEEVAGAVVPGVVLAIDTSGSTAGEPIEAATAAAVALAEQLGEAGAALGLVRFADDTETVAALSEDTGPVLAGLQDIEAGGETDLYDGVARAARLLASHDGPRDVIVFSDGENTTEGSTLDDVRALLSETGVRVTAVLLRSEEFSVAPLEAMAEVNGGRVIEVEDAAELADAFEVIAGDLTNRLSVAWTAPPAATPTATINVVATYQTDGGAVSDGVQVTNPRLPVITPPREVTAPTPVLPVLGNTTGAYIAAGAAGAAVLLLLFLVLAGAGERRRRGALEGRLSAYRMKRSDAETEASPTLSQRAGSALDSIPRPRGLDARIEQSIEHADWPLRVGEFLIISVGTAVLGLMLGGVLLQSVPIAVLGLVLGAVGPWAYLQIAVSRRRSAFADQLPTILQVLAGSLRAGHAFSTALDGAVDEVDEPARSELRRAAVETRLGRPVDRSLAGVAERMGSTDLRWVIGALEVQREVGGNLAEILMNVADTLRDRASVARHVKALTAEGRLSAVFISAMPFVMFLYLTVTNPDYIRPLFTETLGQIMLVVGLVLMVIGIVVLNRLVQPKY